MANKEKNMHRIQEIFRRKVQCESERTIYPQSLNNPSYFLDLLYPV